VISRVNENDSCFLVSETEIKIETEIEIRIGIRDVHLVYDRNFRQLSVFKSLLKQCSIPIPNNKEAKFSPFFVPLFWCGLPN
jgi:hypothetical protein